MPHFYLDIDDHRHIVDEEGQEFPDLEAARAEAVKSARSMMREAIWQGRLPLNESILILDWDRRHLATVRYRDTVEIDE